MCVGHFFSGGGECTEGRPTPSSALLSLKNQGSGNTEFEHEQISLLLFSSLPNDPCITNEKIQEMVENPHVLSLVPYVIAI